MKIFILSFTQVRLKTINILFFAFLLIVAFVNVPGKIYSAEEHGPDECVVLLHGLGRTSRSMDFIKEALESRGYRVINSDYPSQDKEIETLALDTIPSSLQQCNERPVDRIHFVTHSMGGILVRYFLSEYVIENLGRVVMLSPPNQGSEVADHLKDWPIYKWYNGPAGQQLGTDPESLVMQLGPVGYPVGIITGNDPSFLDFWLEGIIPGPGDGKVSVERAKVAGMTDFLVLPYSHTFIMEEEEVILQVKYFLRNKRFFHKLHRGESGEQSHRR